MLGARRGGIGHPDYLEIRYEDLILRTEETLRLIYNFPDLDYDEVMHRAHLPTVTTVIPAARNS